MIYFYQVFIFLLGMNLYAHAFQKDEYYTNANKNRKQFYQVPKNYLIFAKYQGVEPHWLYKGELRGKGNLEPLFDELILTLRKNNIDTYTDYFTPAKSTFYRTDPQFEICNISGSNFEKYKRATKMSYVSGKYHSNSIPHLIRPAIGFFGILSSKTSSIEKYKYPGTQVYSVKGILDDPNLYTVQVKNMSSEISSYVYENQHTDVSPLYKRRVYEFVASDGIQVTLMLQGRRMHWVDLRQYEDYFLKKLKIGPETIAYLPYSHKNPLEFTDEDLRVSFFNCNGPMNSKNKIDKIIKILNSVIKKRRTDLDYWTKNLKAFHKADQSPYVPPSESSNLKLNFERKKEIDEGKFD